MKTETTPNENFISFLKEKVEINDDKIKISPIMHNPVTWEPHWLIGNIDNTKFEHEIILRKIKNK